MSTVKLPAFAEALGVDMIKFSVGQEGKIFRAHKDMIYEHVDPDDSFPDIEQGKVHLPSDEPFAFACFLEWVYKKDMEILSEKMSIVQRVQVYFFAAKYDTLGLANELMRSIHASVGEQPSLLDKSVIDYVYKHSQPGCSLRDFIDDAFVHMLLRNCYERIGHNQDNMNIDSEQLMKLTRDNEEFHRSLFNTLRGVNNLGSEAPWNVDVEHWLD